jgi:nucleotide-binding universal stress UspA family protein
MILICYDGSDDAKAAIDRAAMMLAHEPAEVVTVWESVEHLIKHAKAIAPVSNQEQTDEARRAAAEDQANEGAELARAKGIDARSFIVEQETTTADAILDEAEKLNANAIVIGSRGKSLLNALLLGSVAQDLIQRADRMVVVAPSHEVAEKRAKDRHTRIAAAAK